jgi:beta-lactamase regulating signal transducer with metallopeptidase domain/ABC-type glycerol-3-phosphate transport system substrate-binding protein
MYSEFLNWLLRASLKASLIILIVLSLRKIFRNKISARWYMAFWIIVIIRLVLPWAPKTNASMFNIFKLPANGMKNTFIAIENIGHRIENLITAGIKLENFKSYSVQNYNRQNKNKYSSEYGSGMKTTDTLIGNDTDILAEGTIEKNVSVKDLISINTVGNSKDEVGKKSVGATAIAKTLDSEVGIYGHDISYLPETSPLLYYLLTIWIVGLLTFSIYIIITNFKFYRRTNDKKLITDERICSIAAQCRTQLCIKRSIKLFETAAVDEPSIYRVLNPVMLFPPNMIQTLSDLEIKCILLHELMHYRKKDNTLNMLTMLISGLHWFNPLVHIAFTMMRYDNELLCDSKVLKHISNGQYTYGKTLLKLACGTGNSSLIMSEGIGGNRNRLKERINRIAGTTKHAVGWSITAVLMVIVVGCTGLSNEKELDVNDRFLNLEPIEINFYSMSYSGNAPVIEDMLKEIEQKLIDSLRITPIFHWIPYEKYDDELKKLITSGEAVDAFTSYGVYSDVNQDIAMDISLLFPQYAPNYYKQLKSTKAGEMLLKSAVIDDKQYMIPWNYFNCPRYYIIARKDLVSKYASDEFKTLEDYGNFLKAVKENEKGVLPGLVYADDFFDAYIKGNGYYQNNGSCFYSKFKSNQPTLYPISELDEFIDAYNLLKNWKDNEYVVKSNLSRYFQYLSLGELASCLVGRDHDRIRLASPVKYEYSIYPLYMDSTHELRVYSQGVVVAKHSKNPDRVLMFIEWMHDSQDNYDLFMYGIKEKNYELKDDNIYFPSGITQLVYWDIMCSEFFKDYRFTRSSFIEANEYRKALLESSLKNVITSDELFENIFKTNRNDFNKEIMEDEEFSENMNKMYQNLSDVYEKYYDNIRQFYKFIDTGYFISTPQKLKEDQKDAGVEKIIESYEKILERIMQ